jgi:Ca2+-binding RTX toxin-like protein
MGNWTRALFVVLAALLALALPEAAHAAVTATFDDTTGELRITGDDQPNTVTVGRAGETIIVGSESGPVIIPGMTQPTVTNTENIAIDGGAGQDQATLDGTNGSFGPGKTNEGNEPDSEIEFVIEIELFVLEEDGANTIDIGQLTGNRNGINLNGDADGDDVAFVVIVPGIELNLGNGQDSVSGFSGPGLLGAFQGNLVVNSGDGNDVIDGGAGMSTLNGEGGDDQFGILQGNNLVDGGEGTDPVFVIFTGAINLSQTNGLINLDNTLSGDLANVEGVGLIGGDGNDTVNASGVGVLMEIFPLGGNDVINAGMNNDFVDGGFGNDRVDGGAGDDELLGDDGDDFLVGGPNQDRLNGGDGTDFCDGEFLEFCETFPTTSPGATTPGGTGTPGQGDLFDRLVFNRILNEWTRGARRTTINRALSSGGFDFVFNAQPGTYVFQVTTPLAQRQSVGRSAQRRQVVVARATKRVSRAGRTRVKVRLTRQGRRALRRARRLRVTLRLRYTSPSGQRASGSRNVTLKRRRR